MSGNVIRQLKQEIAEAGFKEADLHALLASQTQPASAAATESVEAGQRQANVDVQDSAEFPSLGRQSSSDEGFAFDALQDQVQSQARSAEKAEAQSDADSFDASAIWCVALCCHS